MGFIGREKNRVYKQEKDMGFIWNFRRKSCKSKQQMQKN